MFAIDVVRVIGAGQDVCIKHYKSNEKLKNLLQEDYTVRRFPKSEPMIEKK